MPYRVNKYRVAGMDGLVAKPIPISAMFEAIESALAGDSDLASDVA